MSGVDDLYTLCREYLDACAAAVATAPGGAIARAYVATALPAFDCEQLTVHAGGPAEGDTAPLQPPLQLGHRADNVGAVHLINMTATVCRCAPVITSKGQTVLNPNIAQMEAHSRITLGDLWAIWNYIRARYRDDTLFTTTMGRRRELFFDPAVAVNTAGGITGWQVQIRVQLDGYGA